MALRKFKSLDTAVREKLLAFDYYMYLVRRLTADELAIIWSLHNGEIEYLNGLRDIRKSLELIKKKAAELPSEERA